MCGAQDSWSPVAQHQAMANLLPHSVFSVIESAGHMAPMEQPAAVAQVLAEWLADCGAKHLVLTSRNGAATPAAEAFVTKLRARGVDVQVFKADEPGAMQLESGYEGTWPWVPERGTGSMRDCSLVPPAGSGFDHSVQLSGFEAGWGCVWNELRQLGFAMEWDLATFPYAWSWNCSGGHRHRAGGRRAVRKAVRRGRAVRWWAPCRWRWRTVWSRWTGPGRL